MEKTITLTKGIDGWMAKFSDPEIMELFGTDIIPTAFTRACEPARVMAEIQRLNPGYSVRIVID